MKLARCPKNHYYNSEKYSSCPQCASAAADKNSISLPPDPEESNKPKPSSPRPSELIHSGVDKLNGGDVTGMFAPQPTSEPQPNSMSVPQPAPEPQPNSMSAPQPVPEPQPYYDPNQQYANGQQPYYAPEQQYANGQQPYNDPNQQYANGQQPYYDPNQQYANGQQPYYAPEQQYANGQQPYYAPEQQYANGQQPYNDPNQQYANGQQPYNDPNQQYANGQQPYYAPEQQYANGQQPYYDPNQQYANGQQPYYDPNQQNANIQQPYYDPNQQYANGQQPYYAPEQQYANEQQPVYSPEQPPEPQPVPEPAPQPTSSSLPQTQLSNLIRESGYTGSMEDIQTKVIFTDIPDEPLVGWFVAIGGIEKGASFEVRYGRTTIGRGSIDYTVDVDLHRDASISRGAQAIVVYDPRNKKFIIQSNNGKTLVYVNGNMLMNYTELNLYDVVSLGESDLIFVPLCSERFSWDDLSKG